MKAFEKLAERINDELGVELVDFKRTYAGIHMRSVGTPIWRARVKGSNYEYNSDIPASALLKCKKLKVVNGWSSMQTSIEGE